MTGREAWLFLKTLGKHLTLLLTGGVLMAGVAVLGFLGVMIPAYVQLGILAVTLLLATFRAWQTEYRERLRLTEKVTGFPRLEIAEVDAGTMWGKYEDGTFTDRGPANSVIWLRLRNAPLTNTADSVAEQVTAMVKFYDARGEHFFDMEGRWSHTTQPPQREPGADKAAFLAVQCPIGIVRTIDIAFKVKTRGACYAFNDESYNFDNYENPAFALPTGTILAVVELSGVRVKARVRLQFDNPDGPGELTVLKYEIEDTF
ncbi:MAG: hypothetical protein LAP61_23990 [Acidobacteriia bacterium]|nr:hypothetical protein [Terriglobia bacterium]